MPSSHLGIRECFFAFLLILLVAIAASAQNFRGGISGTVSDQGGAVVPNAKVAATNDATAAEYATTSTSAGQFLFQDLPPGSYTIDVSVTGFKSVKVSNVPVSAGTVYTLPVVVSPAEVTTTVEVRADQLALSTTDATLSTVIPTTVVQDLPQNGRDFTELIGQTPGFAGYAITGGGGTSSVNGTRANQINYQIEGTDNNDIWWNLSAANLSSGSSIAGTLVPLDAIQEFSFVTSSGPEIGRNPGGTMNLIIKSGTNQFHGSAYYFNRNEFFAANSPFAPSGVKKNKERNYNTGASLGAPILKDRLFFFGAFEYQNFIIGNSTNATEPSTAYQAAAENLLGFYGVPVNPVSSALLSLWPANALTGPAHPGNFFANAPETGYSYNGIIKLDYNINVKNHLSAKFFAGEGPQVAVDGSNLAQYYTVAPTHVQNDSIIYDTVFSPSLTNQIYFGVNYYQVSFKDANSSFNPIALGLNTGVDQAALPGAPKIIIGPPASGQGLTGGSSGFDITGPRSFSGRDDNTGHLNDAISYVLGAHQMRFGGEFRQVRVDDYYHANPRGTFNFDGSQGPWFFPVSGVKTSCDGLATKNLGAFAPGYNLNNPGSFDSNVLFLSDFLAGCTSSANIIEGDPERHVIVNSFNLFAQDTWEVSKKLSVSYGLRYDYSGPMHNGAKDLTVFDPNAPNGIAVAGSTIANVYQQYRGAFSPRLGFAYQPKEGGSIVIRGGYGLYYDSPYLIPFLNLSGTSNGGAVGVQDNPGGSKPVAAATAITDPTTGSVNIFVPNKPVFPSLSEAIAGAGVTSLFSVDPKFRPSVTSNYNLNVQKSLGQAVIAQVGYVGSVSRHLTDVVDINQAAQGSAFLAPTAACPSPLQCSRPFFAKFPNYGSINQVQSGENANYNSLQTLIRTAAWHGLTSQFSYTFAHALDYETGLIPYLPQDSTNLRAEYGNSDFDTRHAFVGYVTYLVPGSSHGPKNLTRGWQVSSGLAFHTGQPYTPMASTNTSGNGEFFDRADAVPGVSPYAGLCHCIVNGVVQWFNPAAFQDPPQGQYGTIRRGQYFNPGFSDVDLSVLKNTKITERFTLQLRVDMFNIFNHTNLGLVGTPQAGDGGGAIGSTIGSFYAAPGIGAGEPFNTQLAAKIIF